MRGQLVWEREREVRGAERSEVVGPWGAFVRGYIRQS